MGIDIEIYVLGTCTDEELEVAEAFMMNRVGGLSWGLDTPHPLLERCKYPENRIEVDSGDRYYGHGYERGNWPKIYGGIRAMQAAFSGRPVFYGGDVSEYGQECTHEFLESLWRHWMGPLGDAYRDRSRERNAQ